MKYNLDILKALADHTRLTIIEELLCSDKGVSELVRHVGKSQPNISLALKKLEKAGLVLSFRDKKRIIYYLKDKERVSNMLAAIKNE